MWRLTASFAVLFSGCLLEPALLPDATARTVGERTAVTETLGVRVAVNGDAWGSDPIDLGEVLTPVHVMLENGSEHPLRLTWRDFTLRGDSGMSYRALSVLPADPQLPTGRRDTTVQLELAAWHRAAPVHVAPRFHHRRFSIAPHHSYYYPGFRTWGVPFPAAPYAYGSTWPRALPSPDMLAESLPEGVLEPGGAVDGFVYFPSLSRRESRVGFQLALIDANSGQPLGTANLPLRVRRP